MAGHWQRVPDYLLSDNSPNETWVEDPVATSPTVNANPGITTGQQYDATGKPILKDFESNIDPNTGLLRTQYQTKDVLNRQGLAAMRGEALRDPGTMSRWGQMATNQARNQMTQQVAGQQQQATNQLAMQGGLRTGARERLASQGMRSQLEGGQQALGNVQMQDEQNRQKWLQMLPGQELAAANYDTGVQDTNINRAGSEITQGRLWDTNRYNEAMRAWGAEKTAAATPRSGGKK